MQSDQSNTPRQYEGFYDQLEDVMVAPGRPGLVLISTAHPRAMRIDPADARELARRLLAAAAVAEQ